jgi:chemotaxis receptor (MCP) glutamine deamidase CheD
MINLTDISSCQPLVVLTGEYGIVKGDESIIASPNAKSGVIVIISDQENKITALAHIEDEEKLDENLEKILADMIEMGANSNHLTCNIMENDKS